MWEKLKSLMADDVVFYGLLIVFVGLVGYGLGQRSVLSAIPTCAEESPVTIVDHSSTPTLPESNGMVVVGSRAGTRYHLPECPGAQQMKEENRIEFSSIAAARAAGYTAAANCPGL